MVCFLECSLLRVLAVCVSLACVRAKQRIDERRQQKLASGETFSSESSQHSSGSEDTACGKMRKGHDCGISCAGYIVHRSTLGGHAVDCRSRAVALPVKTSGAQRWERTSIEARLKVEVLEVPRSALALVWTGLESLCAVFRSAFFENGLLRSGLHCRVCPLHIVQFSSKCTLARVFGVVLMQGSAGYFQ
eukprot:1393820-Amphidinium_carterae.1